MSKLKAQMIADLSRRVATAQGQVNEIVESPSVGSIWPDVREPLDHAHKQIAAAKVALDAASYALAHAYLMNGDEG